MTAIPRTITPEHTPAEPLEIRNDYALYLVAATNDDNEFYVWAGSTEAVVGVIEERAEAKRQQFAFRGIKVLT